MEWCYVVTQGHKERREQDSLGTYGVCKQLEESGLAYQREQYGKSFRILPKKIPIDLLHRSKADEPASPLRMKSTQGGAACFFTVFLSGRRR